MHGSKQNMMLSSEHFAALFSKQSADDDQPVQIADVHPITFKLLLQ